MFAKLSSLALIGLLSAAIEAHSWNEQLSLIGDNGSFVANGYPRAYMARTDPGYDGNSMMWLIPGAKTGRIFINDQDMLCHTSQRNPTQSPNYPRLAVAPGSAIAMKYLENGHVTLPQTPPGKQQKGGTVFVFGTTQPQADEKLVDVLKWTADGSGGDKRGKLLQAQNFDDDRCHQINGGPISTQRQQQFPNPVPGQTTGQNELWCESNAIIPKDAPVGKPYTVYWVWQWPTMPSQSDGYDHGKDEYYTTCNDLDVQAQAPQTGRFANTLKQQDPQEKPVQDYLSRSALEPVPWPNGVNNTNGAPASAAPSSQVASPATSTSVSSAPAAGAATVGTEPSVAAAAAQNPGQMGAAPVAPATTSAQAPNLPVAPPGPNLSPFPLSAFTPVASAPSVQTATVASADPPSAPAATGETKKVFAVPASATVFMISNSQTFTIAKRASPTPAVVTASTSATVAAAHSDVHLHPRQFRAGGPQHGRFHGY